MAHLKKNIIVDSTVKASGWVMKQGLSAGVKLLGLAGPGGWIASFLGKKIIDNIIMPHNKALGIKAKMKIQARQEKKKWKLLVKLKDMDLTTEEYIALRKKRAEENKYDSQA